MNTKKKVQKNKQIKPSMLRLTGGIFFDLLLNSRYTNRGYNEHSIMSDLVYAIDDKFHKNISKDSLKTTTSTYKKGASDFSTNLPFKRGAYPSLEIYCSAVKSYDDNKLLSFNHFLDKYIDFNELKTCERLIKGILYIIKNDPTIKDDETFNQINVHNKAELLSLDAIDFQPFLISVLNYIMYYEPDNSECKNTYNYIHPNDSQVLAWDRISYPKNIKINILSINELKTYKNKLAPQTIEMTKEEILEEQRKQQYFDEHMKPLADVILNNMPQYEDLANKCGENLIKPMQQFSKALHDSLPWNTPTMIQNQISNSGNITIGDNNVIIGNKVVKNGESKESNNDKTE